MSFYTGTQCELLYAMPASGGAVTAAAATIMSGTTAANPPFGLPAGFFNPSPTGDSGKSLLIKGGGWYTVGTTAVTNIIKVGLNTTQNTASIAVTLGATGAWTTVASQSNVAFEFELFVTCTAPGKAGTNGSYNSMGHLFVGQANNAANPTIQSSTLTQAITGMMIGAPQTAAAFDPTVTQYVEVSGQWSVTTGSPTQTLTNFYVFGLN
jgi:hypothetical protein